MSHFQIPDIPAISWFTQEQTVKFLRIAALGVAIERRSDISAWLRGEMQDLLPHEGLIAAYRDPARCQTGMDVALYTPDVAIRRFTEAELDCLIDVAYSHWAERNWRPQSVSGKGALGGNSSPWFNGGLGRMYSIFVHGVHDVREGRDSVYILYSGDPVNGRSDQGYLFWLGLLIPQIDTVLRRHANDSLVISRGKQIGDDDLNLSSRELEVLDLIWRGKSNSDVGAALGISPFTVKNHLQRIYEKIGVNNRTQAATKYGDVLYRLRSCLS